MEKQNFMINSPVSCLIPIKSSPGLRGPACALTLEFRLALIRVKNVVFGTINILFFDSSDDDEYFDVTGNWRPKVSRQRKHFIFTSEFLERFRIKPEMVRNLRFGILA